MNTRVLMACLVTIALLCPFDKGTAAGRPSVIGFRNNGTGAYPEADPPMVWSATTNVVWRWQTEPLTATTISSLIIVGHRMFTLGDPMALVCLDKNTGRELWRRDTHVHEGMSETAKAMHAAVARDGRISAIRTRVGLSDGKRARFRDILKLLERRPGQIRRRIYKFNKNKHKGYKLGTGCTEEAAVFFEKLAAEVRALLTVADEERAALTNELAELKARVPGKNEPGFRAHGHHSGCTPASDGERVVAVFPPGLVVSYDLDGNLQWTHAVVDAEGKAGRGATAIVPAIGDGKVLVHRGSILRCLDAATGDAVWNREGLNPGAFGGAAASPAIGHAGGVYYAMYGQYGDVLRLDTGEVVLLSFFREDRAFASQMMGRYWASAVSADRKTLHGISHAVRIPDDPAEPPYMLWKLALECVSRGCTPTKVLGGNHQYGAPMIVNGKIHHLNTGAGNRISTLDAETGKVLVGPMTNGVLKQYNDPIFAGSHIYRFTGDGRCLIRDPEKNFEVVAENYLEPGENQIPVFEGRRMYIRTDLSAYCIEEPRRERAAGK
jgi:hypothetical protein